MRTTMLGVLLWSLASSVHAQQVYVHGVGAKQCGEYLADRQRGGNSFQSAAAIHYASWAWGYLSGYNAAHERKQIQANLPQASVIAFIDKYCRDNPLNGVVAAVDCLMANYGGPNFPHCKDR